MGRTPVDVSGLPPLAIGRIGGGRSRPTGSLDVAVIQSLCRKGVVSDRVAEYGQLVVDECHHLSARSFEQVVAPGESEVRHGAVGHRCPQGRPPSDRLYAVRSRAAPRRHESAGGRDPFRHAVLVRPTPFRPRKRPTRTREPSSTISMRNWSTTSPQPAHLRRCRRRPWARTALRWF